MTTRDRRRSIIAAYLNAGLWGVGSGLASTTLVVYLARAYGAGGLAISWVLATPSLVGLLRLAAPACLELIGARRRFCISFFLASAGVLALLPAWPVLQLLTFGAEPIPIIAATWAGYQLLESIAAVALWSWLGDLVPARVRGRFLGRREAWLHAGLLAGSATAIGVTMLFDSLAIPSNTAGASLRAYSACDFAGAAMMAVAAIVLAGVADIPTRPRSEVRAIARNSSVIAAFADGRFRRFLAFGLWFSFSNGVVQAAQSIFPIAALNIAFAPRRMMDGGLRGGKALLLPYVGRLVDSRGSVPVLAVAQATLALSPLFYLFASPALPWWILGVYACWLAYAGHDVAMPHLMLGLSPPGETATYAAAWFASTQLAYALSTLAGGALLDGLTATFKPTSLGEGFASPFAMIFVGSWLLKTVGIVLALRVPEPLPR